MFLKNKNIIFKIRRSKVTDYAALTFDAMYIIYKHNEYGHIHLKLKENLCMFHTAD